MKSIVCTILIAVVFVVAASGLVKITGSVAQEPPATDQDDAVILAERILIDESDDLVFDEQIQQNLIDELEQSLTLVRIANSKMNEIRARRHYVPGTLILGVTPELFIGVSESIQAGNDPATLVTGFDEFDRLTGKLALTEIETLSVGETLFLHFERNVNLRVAIDAFRGIDGVVYAEPDALIGDGPDIVATKSNDGIELNFINAWGDCPSGCIYRESFLYLVSGGNVTELE